MAHMKLLREFARRPNEIGILFPSSAGLARMISSKIGLEKARSVVEIGPGTAVFTPHVIKKIPKGARYFAVEINPILCSFFTKKFPDLKIYNGDAAKLGEILKFENLKDVDVVISGLPWSLFPLKLQCRIMKAVSESLVEGGHFATYAYLQGTMLPGGTRLKKILRRYFSSVEVSRTVWSNIPPAFVYRCTK